MRLTRVRGQLIALAITTSAVGIAAPHALADPTPPNPTDQQLAQADKKVKDKAAEVGRIAAQLTATDAKLREVQQQAEIAVERYKEAVDAWHDAQAKAKAAQKRAEKAAQQVKAKKAQLDRYIADTYKNAGVALPLAALLTSEKPEDLIHNAGILKVAGSREAEMLDELDRARVRQVNALSEAKAALAEQTEAKAAADRAKAAAEQQVASVQTQIQQISEQKAQLQQDLEDAQRRAGMLHQARKAAIERARREAARRAEEARQARLARQRAQAAAQASRSHHSSPASTYAAPRRSGNARSIAISAALTKLGSPYVWGAKGPYSFDCSGLVHWAYAQAGVSLHLGSRGQYGDGAHVPLSAMRPGDLLFWSSNGRQSGIHHVAMYIGGGQMVEAPTFGVPVHVRSIWDNGELMPYATRVA